MAVSDVAVGFDDRTQARTLAVISAVHLVSHFFWLAFVPLLPALKNLLNVSFVELGLAITVMNVVSALTQAPTGFMVDRYGPRLLLVLGVAIGASGFILIGLFPSYPMLIAGAVLIGLGNAAYHPADYSILSAEMSATRMGRAYSVHSFMGYLGFAVAPPVVLALLWFGGPRFALAASGVLGVVVCLPLLPDLARERRRAKYGLRSGRRRSGARSLLTPSILALTLMFAMINLSTNMMQTYMVVALADLAQAPRAIGNLSLTSFLFALVLGIIAGGFLADRSRHQSIVAAGGFGLAAATVVVAGVLKPSGHDAVALFSLAGFLAGIIMPSRDILVRDASPPGAIGRTFGIVTTGFNFGGMIGPLAGGMLVDHHLPAWIFYGSALFMLATVVIAVAVERAGVRPAG